MPKRLTDCVKKVSRKKGVRSAWGVCVKSTGLKPHRKKKR